MVGQLRIKRHDLVGLGDADGERSGDLGGVGSFHPSGGGQKQDIVFSKNFSSFSPATSPAIRQNPGRRGPPIRFLRPAKLGSPLVGVFGPADEN